ncbi:hypothetical protein [Streptomyces sp. NPDC013489]|uniref:hypothetical protein n=1 Tax=Streptomyces sp. NPDC013489 TaxID=3155606 RepID=UPI0033D05F75
MSESTVSPAEAAHIQKLLREARLLESAFEDDAPAAVAPAAPTAPRVPVPPPGYTLRTTQITTPDGGTRTEYEVVPLAPAAPAAPAASYAVRDATLTKSGPDWRRLPEWLTANRRKIKAAAYLAGAGTLAAGAAIYGPAIGAGAAAAAAGVWAATLTVLKVVGIAVAAIVGLRVVVWIFGGSKKKSSGTFRFSGGGTWERD